MTPFRHLRIGVGIASIASALIVVAFETDTTLHAEDPRHRDLAIHWSPFIYQASQDNYDIPTNFNFDDNWAGLDNWENAETFINNFAARVYYTFQETSGHFWINYLIFHPRDTKAVFYHENDMEGARVIVEKDGSQYGRFFELDTFAHGQVSYTTTPTFVNGTHPAIWIEDKGHGVYHTNNGIFPAACGGMGIWYAGRGAEIPEHCNDRDVSMDLIPFEDTLWPLRFWGSGFPYGDAETWVSGAFFGGKFRGNNGLNCAAKPPWGWFPEGRWFMDPKWTSDSYTYNPYLFDTTSGAAMGCVG